jgi:hypothetical protein
MSEVDLEVGHVVDDKSAVPFILCRDFSHVGVIAHTCYRDETVSRNFVCIDHFVGHASTLAKRIKAR